MRSFVIGFTALALTAAAGARDLTVERLFDAPDLQGPSLRQVRFSPDGTLVSYLRSKDDDPQVYDLWAYDIAAGQHRLLVDSRSLAPAQETLSAEEEARRERQRSAAWHRRLSMGARFARALVPARRRPVSLRPFKTGERSCAAADRDRGL